MLKGIGVSKGIGKAPALCYILEEITVPHVAIGDAEAEKKRFDAAVAEVCADVHVMHDEALEKVGPEEAEIFNAHLMILEDEDSLAEPVHDMIDEGMNAEAAAETVFDMIIDMMGSVEDEYLRQRAADAADLKDQVLRVLLGKRKIDISRLKEPIVLVAKDLAPSDTIKMDIKNIAGIICQEGGKTSHTAILAKAMGLPAIVGCKGILAAVKNGDAIVMDGGAGEVLCNPTAEEAREYEERAAAHRAEAEELKKFRGKPSVSADGHVVAICANIAKPEECAVGVENDCEGVGLFRSEFLYMDRDTLPSEQEQFEAYKKALEIGAGRPITIRTLDAGGDKALPGVTVPAEENPFLGFRAVRICLANRDLFKTQLRALYRASMYGNLLVMFPMISSVEELRAAKAVAAEARAELKAEGVPFREDVPLGMMVEIPSTAMAADLYAKEADFFSIGTNDLTQYTVAVDRGNQLVAHLYTHYNPGVIRLIANTIRAAHDNGIRCCMCGEAAGDVDFIPALLGMGLDQFSISAPGILRARRMISRLSYEKCKAMVEELMKAATVEEVKKTIAEVINK